MQNLKRTHATRPARGGEFDFEKAFEMAQLHGAAEQNSRALNAPLDVHAPRQRLKTVSIGPTAQRIERQQLATDEEGDILRMTADSSRACTIIAKRKATFSVCVGADFGRRKTEKAQTSKSEDKTCSGVTVTAIERTESMTKLNHHSQSEIHLKLIITYLLSVPIELHLSQCV